MISTQKPSITESHGLLGETLFGVEDLGSIFNILRSQLYSNPVLAVCREITCNSRDAHREVGKFDVPIEVHLPHGLDPNFRVKDLVLACLLIELPMYLANILPAPNEATIFRREHSELAPKVLGRFRIHLP